MTVVKICGITREEDALAAAQAGTDLLGFVFYPPSPRNIDPARARRIINAVTDAGYPVRFVGVFVNEPEGHIREIAARCHLHYVQLHGSEPPQLVSRLAQDGLSVIKAVRIGGDDSLLEMMRYSPSLYLLDSSVPGFLGGSGKRFDWKIAQRAKDHGSFLLAGGLNPDNVATAVRAVQPWGVDVSTGVESSPGQKDHDKIRQFIARAKEDDRRKHDQ